MKGILVFLFIVNEPIDKQQDVDQVIFHCPNMKVYSKTYPAIFGDDGKVASAIKVNQWENDISSIKKQNVTEKRHYSKKQ